MLQSVINSVVSQPTLKLPYLGFVGDSEDLLVCDHHGELVATAAFEMPRGGAGKAWVRPVLLAWLEYLPEGSSVQVGMLLDNDVDTLLNAWECTHRHPNETLRRMAHERAALHRAAADKGSLVPDFRRHARSESTHIFISIPASAATEARGVSAWFGDIESDLESAGASIRARRMTKAEIIDLVDRALHPQCEPGRTGTWNGRWIRDDASIACSPIGAYLVATCGEASVAMCTLRAASAPQDDWDGVQAIWRQLREGTPAGPLPRMWVWGAVHTRGPKSGVGSREAAEIQADGQRPAHMSLGVTVIGQAADIGNSATVVQQIFGAVGISLGIEEPSLARFAEQLPGGPSRSSPSLVRRAKDSFLMPMKSALRALLLESDWGGTKGDAGLLLTAPSGCLANLDMNDGQFLPHIVISSGPASDKNLMVSEVIASFMMRGSLVRGITMGSELAMGVRTMGGQHRRVLLDQPFGLNVFAGYTEHTNALYRDGLVELLMQLCLDHRWPQAAAGAHPRARDLLGRALHSCWASQGANLTPRHVGEWLCDGNHGEMAAYGVGLPQQLGAAVLNSLNSLPGWFEHAPEEELTESAVLFSLESLRGEWPGALPIIRDALLLLARRDICRRADRTPALLLLDDAPELFRDTESKLASYQVELAARELRQWGGTLAVTMDSCEVPRSAPVNTAIRYAGTKILLRQHHPDAEGIQSFGEPSILMPLVASLKPGGSASEFVLVHGTEASKQRVHFDPFSLSVLTQKMPTLASSS